MNIGILLKKVILGGHGNNTKRIFSNLRMSVTFITQNNIVVEKMGIKDWKDHLSGTQYLYNRYI